MVKCKTKGKRPNDLRNLEEDVQGLTYLSYKYVNARLAFFGRLLA